MTLRFLAIAVGLLAGADALSLSGIKQSIKGVVTPTGGREPLNALLARRSVAKYDVSATRNKIPTCASAVTC